MRYLTRLVLLLISFFPFFVQDLTAQVAGKILYDSRGIEEATLIQIRWASEEEHTWRNANEGRLDIMGISTWISSQDLLKSGNDISTFQFDFAGSASLELLVDLTYLASGERIYLSEKNTGRVIFDFSLAGRNPFLSPAFDPASTLLIWEGQENASRESRFTIESIYYQPVQSSRLLDIGFGTAFDCHPNAACKQDSMMKLISNSAVRMRMVMEEGIGWCTGSLVNTTRHDKIPYLLTAYHCQFDFTPRYELWRFDFQYRSEECANPAIEPQFYSMTGCQRLAGGQASDFLLVLLNEPIPLNQEVTFAGWDRAESTLPDTSYLIHHPNADIRKISTSVNEAVIHPNQIGWTEGYTTPGNHHFRLKFTEGGHEPGSSGGPLFNEKGLLVGQLHGGTKGCEATNNAFSGRLAKSWDLGTTPQERLRDWLDPDQTGEVRIVSLENKSSGDLVDIQGQVVDPKGRPVKNTMISISGSAEETLMTGDDGTFMLAGIYRNGTYTLVPNKTTHPSNGVNALDLVAIQKHLLGKDFFDFEWQYIAADATNNGEISVGDILVILKLLLGKTLYFPSSPSWRFDPPEIILTGLPAGEPVQVQITAIKIGDVNGTSDPSK